MDQQGASDCVNDPNDSSPLYGINAHMHTHMDTQKYTHLCIYLKSANDMFHSAAKPKSTAELIRWASSTPSSH